MGRDATISYEQVAAAAAAMQAEGTKPTSRAIRERLGHIGSMGTVNRLLQEWRAAPARHPSQLLALPLVLERAIVDYIAQELERAKAVLQEALIEQQEEAADLAIENERLAFELHEQFENQAAQSAELATMQGRIVQIEEELTGVRKEVACTRADALAARIDLAKALMRLEAMPRLESDLAGLRGVFDMERQGRVAAEQEAAVLAAQLEAARARASKAEIAEAEAMNLAASSRDAVALEASRTEAAHNNIAHLTGKIEAMQVQIGQQTMALARSLGKKAGMAEANGQRSP